MDSELLVFFDARRMSGACLRVTCGQVQEAEVGVHDGLMAQHEQGHLGSSGLAAGRFHLANGQQHLHQAGTVRNYKSEHTLHATPTAALAR